MAQDPLREEEHESEWEAAPAVAIVIGLQLVMEPLETIRRIVRGAAAVNGIE